MRAFDLSFQTHATGWRDLLPGIRPAGGGQWEMPLQSGHSARLYIEDAWLTLNAWISSAERPQDLWNYLVTNNFAGNIRFALGPTDTSLLLCADLHLDEQPTPPVQVTRLVAGFNQALADIGRRSDMPRVAELPPAHATDIGRLLSETGWDFKQGDGRVVSVALEGGFRARFEPLGDATRVSVELTSLEKKTCSVTRDAIAVLLLTVSGMTRLVRPCIEEQTEHISVALQTVCDGDADAANWNHALSALSVACELCKNEIEALSEEHIAAQYLSSWYDNRFCS
jgi:hypothetical protein